MFIPLSQYVLINPTFGSMLVRLLFISYPCVSIFLPIQGSSSRTIFQRQGQGAHVQGPEEGQGQGRGQRMGSTKRVHRPLVLLSCSHVFHKQCVLHFEDFLVDSDVSQGHLCYYCTFCVDEFYHFEFSHTIIHPYDVFIVEQ
jgi:hypothetical protein